MGSVEEEEGGGFSWGGVEGWGENSDNCNWITIKILKKVEVGKGEIPNQEMYTYCKFSPKSKNKQNFFI